MLPKMKRTDSFNQSEFELGVPRLLAGVQLHWLYRLEKKHILGFSFFTTIPNNHVNLSCYILDVLSSRAESVHPGHAAVC